MTKYTELKNNENEIVSIRREDGDGKIWIIPISESNSDYQRYLRWLENPDADESGTL